jgi:serine/threonine protein kinase
LAAEHQLAQSFQVGGGGANDLQILSEDRERLFYRGVSPIGAAALLLVPSSEHPSPTILERFAHEFSLKDELDAAAAVRPIGLDRERGRPMLVLEDLGASRWRGCSAPHSTWNSSWPVPTERQAPKPPATIADTPAYMAPEEIGRLNRSIDSRCDLYALGATPTKSDETGVPR